ncbi:MAG: diphthine--ammonia ligase [Candidatus Pacearchaeota archaeon]
MKVAILFSGGKDSVYAIEYAMQRGWRIKYLLSFKPSRTDCYLFHFAGVEVTPKIANAIGLKHIYAACDVADPEKEAELVRKIVSKNRVDALILGGVGLQETQLRALQHALMPLRIEVFASHAGYDHEEIMQEMIKKGYDIRISQFAVEGLGMEWLGKKLDEQAFEDLKTRAQKFGFHVGGEGGHYDTIVLDGPIFKKKLHIEAEKVEESEYSGYIKIKNAELIEKSEIKWAV